ncbi:hypothetical protein DL764_007285 [Monosporascus ibericus]|uniref:Uncharacterized protein n=1 Tax=Monosporascus ibericus TaxID=155417 RepID=A0A4V1X9S7_9PEZI|nr:hypothetical protein DL764_007285 [Monosporascus ibericus]
MAALRIVELRSLNRALPSQFRIQPPHQISRYSSIALRRTRCPHAEALVLYQVRPRRHQSSSAKQKSPEQKPPTPPFRLILAALRQSLSFRPVLSAFRGQNLRSLFRQSPEELVLAIVLSIAKSLRRALYYSNYSPDPPLALKYYKLALEQCSAAGLDPFSDEVLGIKIQLAAWLEKIGNYQNSIDVLEALLRDCKKWVEVMEKGAQDGLIDKFGFLTEKGKSSSAPKLSTEADREAGSDPESDSEQKPENLWAKRTRVLGKSVGISVKLGELYADEHVLQSDAAGERLVWAVETVLKELQRRQVEGIKEGEGDWMSPEQIGGALEVNNLAISLAQQPVSASVTDSQIPGSAGSTGQAPTRATLLASARQWALQAEATARKVEGENRTEECDEACAVALSNLGDIAAMAGDFGEAKRRFKESLELSKKIGFEPAIAQSQDGLKRVSKSR